MTIPERLPDQVAQLYKSIAEIERRLQNSSRTGKIAEVDASKGLVRVELLPDDGTGKPYVSPWVPWLEAAMGANKTHMPPSIGQQVKIVSENGDMTDAVVDTSLPSDENKRPSEKDDEYILSSVGKSLIKITDGGDKMILSVGKTTLTLTDDKCILATPDFEGEKT